MGQIEANNTAILSHSDAAVLWENGEFSDWVNLNGGLPIEINGQLHDSWDDIEDALADAKEEW